MKYLLILSSVSAGIGLVVGGPVNAGCYPDGGVSQHGRIVTRIHRNWCGAMPAPGNPVFVQQSPQMVAVPFVSAASVVTAPAVPMFGVPTAPSAPNVAAPALPAVTAPAAPVTNKDLEELRTSLRTLRDELNTIKAELPKK